MRGKSKTTHYGTVVWYVRKGDDPRIRIKGEYGSPEFTAAYTAAVNDELQPNSSTVSAASLEWLIARCRETGGWLTLSAAARRQRENIFKGVIANVGKQPYQAMTRPSSSPLGRSAPHVRPGAQLSRRHAGPVPMGT